LHPSSFAEHLGLSITKAPLKDFDFELNKYQEKSRVLDQLEHQGERPPAYFMYNEDDLRKAATQKLIPKTIRKKEKENKSTSKPSTTTSRSPTFMRTESQVSQESINAKALQDLDNPVDPDFSCYFPVSAMVLDKQGKYIATKVETLDDVQDKQLKATAKEIEKLKSRDSEGNVAHMKAIFNTIRVVGRGHIGKSIKLLNQNTFKSFQKKLAEKYATRKDISEAEKLRDRFLDLTIYLKQYS
jgi:hypothetical protein